MALPVLPVLKLIALGTIKIVVLGIGALVVPVLTLRLVLGGTGESIRLAALWMIEHNQLEQQEADTFLESLGKVQSAQYSRSQARGLLFAMIKKTVVGTVAGIRNSWRWTLGLFKRF